MLFTHEEESQFKLNDMLYFYCLPLLFHQCKVDLKNNLLYHRRQHKLFQLPSQKCIYFLIRKNISLTYCIYSGTACALYGIYNPVTSVNLYLLQEDPGQIFKIYYHIIIHHALNIKPSRNCTAQHTWKRYVMKQTLVPRIYSRIQFDLMWFYCVHLNMH